MISKDDKTKTSGKGQKVNERKRQGRRIGGKMKNKKKGKPN